MVAVATAPFGATTVSGGSAERRPQHRRLRPAGGTQLDRRRRAVDVDLLDHELGPTSGDGGGDRRRCGRHGAHRCRRPSRPAAIGGRFGPERTTSSRLYSTRTGRPWRSARRLATAATSLVALPPNAPPLAERRHRLATRRAPRGVRLEVARLDPCGLQRASPVARRELDRPGRRGRRPAALHLAGGPRASVNVSRTCHSPSPPRTATSAPSGAVSSAKPRAAEGDGRSDVLRHAAFQARPLPPSRPSAVAPSGAIRRTGRCRRSSASRCSGTGGRRGRGAPRRPTCGLLERGDPHDDPRRAEPALRRAAAANASAHSRQRDASTEVTSRPATRPTGVTHETRGLPSTRTVQQPHWPCGLQPSLTERAPRRSRRTSRRVTSVSAIST